MDRTWEEVGTKWGQSGVKVERKWGQSGDKMRRKLGEGVGNLEILPKTAKMPPRSPRQISKRGPEAPNCPYLPKVLRPAPNGTLGFEAE